jgi:hypothetical protein
MKILETVEQRLGQEKLMRLSDQLEDLKRRVVLLDVRTRGQGERENRVLRNMIHNLQHQVSELRIKMKEKS